MLQKCRAYLGIGIIHICHTHADEASQTGHFARHISSAHALLHHGCQVVLACPAPQQQAHLEPHKLFAAGGMCAELSVGCKEVVVQQQK